MRKFFFSVSMTGLILIMFFPNAQICAAELSGLEVNLSYAPTQPYNDPSGSNPMELKISSSILYANDENYVNYSWKIYGSNNRESASWREILKPSLADSSPLVGFGLKEIKFKLAFENPAPKYLKVRLSASENNDPSGSTTGEGEIIIPIPSVSSEIKVFKTTADAGNFNDPLTFADERCLSDAEKSVCPVAKDEIIGLKVDSSKLRNFIWSVDGTAVVYEKCLYADCNTDKNGFTYLPILKSIGETYNIELRATDRTTGERLRINKLLQVVSPTALISSTDKTTCQPVLLGYFKDLDDNLTPDYSFDLFEAKSGGSLTLKPTFNIPFSTEIVWNIDGIEITRDNAASLSIDFKDDGTIIFPLNKEPGYSFPVTVSAFYSQPNETKKVLNSYWQVGLNNFYEKPINATIKINVVSALRGEEATEDISQKNTRNKVLATLISNIPVQLIFLAKIAFIGVLILFGSQFLLSLLSKENNA